MFQPEVKSLPQEDISILIKVANHSHHYLCDCGDASGLTVKECQQINAIFISHTHIDHFINFDQLLRHQIGLARTIVICGPQHITQQVQSKIKGFTWNLIEEGAITYEVREIINENQIQISTLQPPLWNIEPVAIKTTDTIYENDTFVVSTVALDHKIPSIAYKFSAHDTTKINLNGHDFKGGPWIGALKTAFENNEPETELTFNNDTVQAKDLFHLLDTKKGATLGIIMDHAAHVENHDKIEQHFSHCDQVFIECFYKDEDQTFADTNYHSYASASAAIMKKSKVKLPVPVHFSRKYTDEERQELIAQFKDALQNI